MLKDLKQYILDSEFQLGIKLYENVGYEQLEHDIMVIAYDTENIK